MTTALFFIGSLTLLVLGAGLVVRAPGSCFRQGFRRAAKCGIATPKSVLHARTLRFVRSEASNVSALLEAT
jgi:hypothetical protein